LQRGKSCPLTVVLSFEHSDPKEFGTSLSFSCYRNVNYIPPHKSKIVGLKFFTCEEKQNYY
jgi:hypothetical protein